MRGPKATFQLPPSHLQAISKNVDIVVLGAEWRASPKNAAWCVAPSDLAGLPVKHCVLPVSGTRATVAGSITWPVGKGSA